MNPIELPMAPSAPTEPAGARRFRVDGMDCGACAKTVEQAVAALAGVQSAQVSFGNGTMAVAGDAPDEAITGAVARAGYRAHPGDAAGRADPTPFWRRDARALSTTIAVVLLALAVVASLVSAPRVVAEPLYLLSMAVGGWPIARAALLALGRRRLDMNVLMAAGGGRRGRHRRVRRGRLGARAVRGRHRPGGDGARAQPPHRRVADGPRAGPRPRARTRRRDARRRRGGRGRRADRDPARRADPARRGRASPGRRASTRRRSPASRCPSTSRPATSCSPGR